MHIKSPKACPPPSFMLCRVPEGDGRRYSPDASHQRISSCFIGYREQARRCKWRGACSTWPQAAGNSYRPFTWFLLVAFLSRNKRAPDFTHSGWQGSKKLWLFWIGNCISYNDAQWYPTKVAEWGNEQVFFILGHVKPGRFTRFTFDNLEFYEYTNDGRTPHCTTHNISQYPDAIEEPILVASVPPLKSVDLC